MDLRTAHRSHGLVAALVVALAGCTADDPVDRPGMPDAAVASVIPAPSIQSVPERTPLPYVAVRGSTEGARVVSLTSAGSTRITSVLPGGTFCQDAEISLSGDTHLEFFAVGGDGRISEPATVDVTYDSASPEPAMGSCSGSGGECDEVEICGFNDVDEDCDGWADGCDLACSECVDDPYEPNDVAINVPTIEPGSYDMVICPCRDDWFAFHAAAGSTIRAGASFTSSEIDLDLRLYHVDDTGSTGEQVASSVTTSNDEQIDYGVDESGVYYLRVYPFNQDAKPRGSYELVIDD
jgi:hypothetical protein